MGSNPPTPVPGNDWGMCSRSSSNTMLGSNSDSGSVQRHVIIGSVATLAKPLETKLRQFILLPGVDLATFQLCNFWHKNIGTKLACKMLMKLTPGVSSKNIFQYRFGSSQKISRQNGVTFNDN